MEVEEIGREIASVGLEQELDAEALASKLADVRQTAAEAEKLMRRGVHFVQLNDQVRGVCEPGSLCFRVWI